MATYQLRAMSIGEILDGAFAIYRSFFGVLIGVVIVCQGVPTLLYIYIALGGGAIMHPGLYLLATLLSGIGGLVAAGATVWIISEAYLGQDPTMGEALQYALGKMVRIFIAGLAKYLLIFLASLLFLIPGIIVAAGYAVVTQAVVLEELPAATDALGRSWSLTKGYKGKAFILGLVVFLLVGLPLTAAGFVAGVVPSLTATLETLGQLVSLILYPVVACAFTLLYYDLRVRKEAFDLEHLSRHLGFDQPVGA